MIFFSLAEIFSCCFLVRSFYQIMVEGHAEARPFIVGNDIEAVGSRLQTADITVFEPEVLQDATQFRAEPHRTHLAVDLLEDKQAPSFLRIEPCRLDDAHHRVDAAITVDIARLELIHGIRQPPVVQTVETVVRLPQLIGLGHALHSRQPEQDCREKPYHAANIRKNSEMNSIFPKKLFSEGLNIVVEFLIEGVARHG